MAGIKITDLPAAPSAQLTDVFPVDQLPGPVTYKESNSQLLSLFQANGQALTRTNDTNVTMTLGGAPSTALLNAASMTLGWTGQLSVPRGGTGNSTFTAYSVICAGTTATGAFQNVVGLGTAGQQLTSNGAGALPSWQASSSSGTVNSGTANEVAYYATTGTAVSGLTGANRSVLVTNNTGVPSMLASASTTGQVLQGSTTGAPTWSTPTYPSASGTAGFILRSDGTNNVYSQSTFADTYAASGFLYANGANNIAGLATANNGLPVTGNTGIPVMLGGPGATGRVLTSNAAAAPSWSTSTFPSVGGAAGNILISDGTNYIASTSLWPNTVGTTGKLLRSNGTSNAYTTSTYPDTNAASTLLYASSANVMAALATANSSVLVTDSGGVPSLSTSLPASTTIGGLAIGIITSWVAYTPTITGFGTPTNVGFFSRRVGDCLEIIGRFTAGTATGVKGTITMGYAGTNANVSSNATVVPAIRVCGVTGTSVSSGSAPMVTLIDSNVNYLSLGVNTTGNASLTEMLGNALPNSTSYSIQASVPVTTWP